MSERSSADHDAVRREFDAGRAAEYRKLDERAVNLGASFAHYSRILTELTEGTRRPLDVLEIGCGSGRYFHCLRNVRRLVGLDLSEAMIEQARRPLYVDRISATEVELLVGTVDSAALDGRRFDLVYSIGVLGEYAPFDVATADRIAALLAPGGSLLVTVVDSASRVAVPETGQPSLPRRLVRKAFPQLPVAMRRALNARLSPHYLSPAGLAAVLQHCRLEAASVSAYVHPPGGWLGTHLDIVHRG